MKARHTRVGAVCAVAGLLCGCGWLTDKEEKPAANAPQLVGRIASVPPDANFVLIESYGEWSVPVGATLTVHGPDDRAANLVVTGERLRHHVAADVRSGKLALGDAVYWLPPAPEAEKKDEEVAPGTENG